MKKTIYIAGKVTGLPEEEVINKFTDAQEKLEKMKFNVINPIKVVARKCRGWDTTWQTAMKVCLEAMMTADAVYLLPCWKDSKGAIIEKELAEKIQIPFFEDLKDLALYFTKKTALEQLVETLKTSEKINEDVLKDLINIIESLMVIEENQIYEAFLAGNESGRNFEYNIKNDNDNNLPIINSRNYYVLTFKKYK